MAQYTSFEKKSAKRLGMSVGDYVRAQEFGGVAEYQKYQDRQQRLSDLGYSGGSSDAYTATLEDTMQGQNQLTQDLISNIQTQTDNIQASIDNAMTQVTDLANEGVVDTEGMVARLDQGFEQTKGMIMSQAMASASKAAYELDAYLGSVGSDSRAAVRRQMAQGITSNIINQTQKNIASLYMGHVDKVIDTTLKGGEINANVKLGAAKTLGDLAGKQADLLLGTSTAMLNAFTSNINYAVDLMNAHTSRMQAETQRELGLRNIELGYEEMDLKRDLAELSQETALLTDRDYMRAYGSTFRGWESEGYGVLRAIRTPHFGPDAGAPTATRSSRTRGGNPWIR